VFDLAIDALITLVAVAVVALAFGFYFAERCRRAQAAKGRRG
jgi:hypothetical protein